MVSSEDKKCFILEILFFQRVWIGLTIYLVWPHNKICQEYLQKPEQNVKYVPSSVGIQFGLSVAFFPEPAPEKEQPNNRNDILYF